VRKKPRTLTSKEAEFMADYFHNEKDMPDVDGYCGHYSLPEGVMVIYRTKYQKIRGWN